MLPARLAALSGGGGGGGGGGPPAVITASAGNHALALAYHARELGHGTATDGPAIPPSPAAAFFLPAVAFPRQPFNERF